MKFIQIAAYSITIATLIIIYLFIGPVIRIFWLKGAQAFIRLSLHLVLKMLTDSLTFSGRENIPKGPALYVIPHVSKVDPFLIFVAVPEIKRFILSYAIFKYNLIIGYYAWLIGCIFVKKRRKTVDTAVQALKKSNVIIYPEGDIMKRISAFKSGYKVISEKANVPIVPTAIIGSVKSVTGNAKQHIRVHFGKPISPGSDAREAIISLTMEITGRSRSEVADDSGNSTSP